MTAKVPGAINLTADQITADMILALAGTGPQVMQTTIANLAQFLETSDDVQNVAITTVGAGTLTAAGLIAGLITRTGPTAAYTDTTATAALILAAWGADTPALASRLVYIKNTVPFAQTLAAGAGVTLAPTTIIIPPNSMGLFLLTLDTTVPAMTLRAVAMVPLTTSPLLATTTLSTVGAGTILGAAIAGGVVTRTGSQSNAAFTDTTDTADLIIAALPNANIGQSFLVKYRNTTDAIATLTGGVGVTVSGIAAVPPNTVGTFLLTYTAASTVTMVGLERSVPNTTSGTFVANGATPVTVANTLVTANSNIIVTLKTAGGTVSPTRPNILTITPGTGFTVGGVASDSSTYNYLIIN